MNSCGYLGSSLSFLSVSNPPNTLYFHFTGLQGQHLPASEGLSFSSVDKIFSTSDQWLSYNTCTQDMLAQDLEGSTLPK